jgi:hypothetical protein
MLTSNHPLFCSFSNGQYGVSFVGNDGFAGTGSLLTMWVTSCAIRLFDEEQKSVILQGGLKLDYEILKSLKFTSQFNGEYYTWKNYNFEDTRNIWLAADPSRDVSQYNPTANVNLLTKVEINISIGIYQITSLTMKYLLIFMILN